MNTTTTNCAELTCEALAVVGNATNLVTRLALRETCGAVRRAVPLNLAELQSMVEHETVCKELENCLWDRNARCLLAVLHANVRDFDHWGLVQYIETRCAKKERLPDLTSVIVDLMMGTMDVHDEKLGELGLMLVNAGAPRAAVALTFADLQALGAFLKVGRLSEVSECRVGNMVRCANPREGWEFAVQCRTQGYACPMEIYREARYRPWFDTCKHHIKLSMTKHDLGKLMRMSRSVSEIMDFVSYGAEINGKNLLIFFAHYFTYDQYVKVVKLIPKALLNAAFQCAVRDSYEMAQVIIEQYGVREYMVWALEALCKRVRDDKASNRRRWLSGLISVALLMRSHTYNRWHARRISAVHESAVKLEEAAKASAR